MFKFYLDNNLVSDPVNWDDFTETIERDEAIKGLLPKYEIKLKFNAGGYAYLMSRLTASGFCGLVELRIEDENGTILNGYIFLTECKFNLNKCFVECEVEDNNYGARIHRNKSIKVFIDTDKTKNGEALTLCTYNDIDFFTPTSGTYSGATRRAYNVADCFRFLIEFMTDNLVGFESTFLTTRLSASDAESLDLRLITGTGIRTPLAAYAPFISFEDLFKEVNKKYPIAFTMITGSDGRPTMKIEDEAYFFGATDAIQIDYIEDLQQSFNNEVLYSSVKFGGETADFNVALHHFGSNRFTGFLEEQYFLQGECNIDKTLDLYGDFIVDSNIIEELFVTNTTNDSYDDKVFFVVKDATLNKARKWVNPVTLSTPNYYNGSLTNDQVSSRYNYNGSVAIYLSGPIVGFRASKTATQAYGAFTLAASPGTCSSAPETRAIAVTGVYVVYNDDTTAPNFDTVGNYSTALSRYTASITGLYVFETSILYNTTNLGGDNFNMYYKAYVEFRRFDSGGALIQTSQSEDPINPSGFYSVSGNNTIAHSVGFNLNAGDYIQVAFWFSYAAYDCNLSSSIITSIQPGIDSTWFRAIAAPDEGGVYQSESTTPYRASKFEFEFPLSTNKYDILKLDLSKGISFNYQDNDNRRGWLRRLERNFEKSTAKWELISNVLNSN